MIKLLLLDVDGTLTDGALYFDESLREIKAFNVKDGLGMVVWKQLKKEIAIITGRTSAIVKKRMEDLGIQHVFMGVKNKGVIVEQLKKDLKLSTQEIACVGDDYNDLGMFKACALSFAPFDAHPIVKKKASKVLQNLGGKGAVREAIDYLLELEGLHDEALRLYL
ncbi:KdsC family phosphatase [Helicobacter cetorum]|uniref:3-deoxy-D-manno-octulosonate 8-phosphate phosphatase KdsC n=1 Tax=Helicobacter cetorum (strain ATCC BAA-540 / CCUG 52418 / MIT 99-5656) TaxID=1163745 RepID=I0ES42_HELCM|nr:HAD-IIIA family hydrolase [Helicobacter cetorum]AFI05761.1 3-deoxy-D-manno-octulosonate 8-phosphate phosphatase [Helicobacter cetorum MIT 99-5656]